MTKKYSAEMTGVLDGLQQSLGNGNVNAGRLHSDRQTFTSLSANYTTSDTLSLGFRRGGDRVVGHIISASTNMSAASIAIGNATTAAKYKAAATLPNATSVFVPCIATALDDAPLTTREELIATISGATIPDGILVIETVYASR